MDTKKPNRPSREVIAELARAACRNARAYLDDADVLADAGRDVRAFALTVMGAEEFGKAFWAQRILEDDSEAAWDSLQAALGGRGVHQHRLATLLALEHMVAEQNPADPTSGMLGLFGANDIFSLRNLALYVELQEEEVWSPQAMVSLENVGILRRALAKSIIINSIIIEGSLPTHADHTDPSP